MRELIIKPTIYKFDQVSQFLEEYNLKAGDLVITNEFIYDAFFKEYSLDCEIIFQEKYGFGEPTDEMVEQIYKGITKPFSRLFAIGGGTIIDICKILALKEILPVADLFEGKIEAVKEKELYILPTTCGTGSEVTNVSILALLSRNTKKGLAVDALYADGAILIPQLLQSLPFGVFATSSIDALVHGVESALSPNGNETTRMFSYKAIEMILKNYLVLKKSGREKVTELYEEILLASNYAGIAFGNAGCAAVHALSYPLGATYHVAHGESNYAMFTGVMKKYMEINSSGELEKMIEFLCNILACEKAVIFENLEDLLNFILPKKNLREYGMKEEEIESFAQSVMENQQRLLKNNYVPLSKEQIMEIYKSCY